MGRLALFKLILRLLFSIFLSACFFPYCIPYLKIGRFEAAVGWGGNGCCYGAGYISRHMLDWLGSSLLVVSPLII